MEIDKTTLNDLSIFNNDEEFSIFSKINLCSTSNGREKLFYNFNNPLPNITAIEGVQQTIQLIISKKQSWPMQISNGTILMIEKFYTATIDDIPQNPSPISVFAYKLLHGPDFSLVKYSVLHCFDFIKGMQQLVQLLLTENAPAPLKKVLHEVKKILNKEDFLVIATNTSISSLRLTQQINFGYFIRYHFKRQMFELLAAHAQLDAWYGMAQAVEKYKLQFPAFITAAQPVLKSIGLYHLLLPSPVAYNVTLNKDGNFLFLTGANMGGKSTFIKSVGSAVFLAHTGMGVPAKAMQLTFFDGMLSNINVVDNLIKGESYFYNEVQRIKSTVNKVNDGKQWLILIDELFKGTNVQDAMKCSSTVIEGLLKIEGSLFILSTHLYEIGEDLKKYPNIQFKYFETSVINDQLYFSYQLKEGISNDRLGYFILRKEGVVDMLERL